MLRTFQDDTLPQTRRSIILFSVFSVFAYKYELTIDLDKIGFLKGSTPKTIEPKYFGAIIVSVIMYLLWRLVHFIPIYQSNINTLFDEFFQKVEERRDELNEKIERKLSTLQSIDTEAIDEKIKEFDKYRTEVIERIEELSETVTSASESYERDVGSLKDQLKDLTERICSIPGNSSEGQSDIDRDELVEKYRELLNPPFNIRQSFRIMRTVLDEHRSDLSDIGLPSISSVPKDLEAKIQDFINGDYSATDEFEDNKRDARQTASAEANTFSVWVPAVAASLGLAFGVCLLFNAKGYLCPQIADIFPLIVSIVVSIPTLLFVKYYRPGKVK